MINSESIYDCGIRTILNNLTGMKGVKNANPLLSPFKNYWEATKLRLVKMEMNVFTIIIVSNMCSFCFVF